MMMFIGVTLALPGNVSSDPLALIVRTGIIDEAGLALIFGLTGAMRCVALYANGNAPIFGPRARAIGSSIAVIIWSQLTFASMLAGIAAGRTTLAAAIYGTLTVGELVSCYRASFDAGRGN